jgi:hypothetical protein
VSGRRWRLAGATRSHDTAAPEPWPGRNAEACQYSDAAIGHLQRARSAIGVLAGVLAQDKTP